MKFYTQLIGPEEATEILASNTRNRLPNKKLVQRYASDMERGEWAFVGDPIRIAHDGTLLDGQHRLEAIRKSGTKQTLMVITGLDLESQAVVDIGRPRKLADVLRINGEKHHTTLAAALVYVWGLDNGVNFAINPANWRPSTAQLLDTLERHPQLRDSCNAGGQMNSHIKIPSSIATFRHYQLGMVDGQDRDDFWKKMIRKDFYGETDPLNRLYVKLMEDAANPQRRMDTAAKHALLVKTWNYYRDGAEVRQLKWTRGGRSREPFPTAI